MTRIIAGDAGGTLLDVPARGTRPTSDRVRESLFGALEAAGALDATRVADLYAGSGALGLEAVSRGARSADLVERSAQAADVARRNVARVRKALGRDVAIVVHQATVAGFLAGQRGPFDLVLLDPPYDLGDIELASALAAVVSHLAPDGLVVVERAARSPEPVAPGGLSLERHRRYGDTAVWWLRSETSTTVEHGTSSEDGDPQPRPASQSR